MTGNVVALDGRCKQKCKAAKLFSDMVPEAVHLLEGIAQCVKVDVL